MRRARTYSWSKVIIIYFAVAFGGVAIQLFFNVRSARRHLQEFKYAEDTGLEIWTRLRDFKERQGEFPETLAKLDLPAATTKNFVYIRDTNGYSLAYYGTNYSTPKKGWTDR